MDCDICEVHISEKDFDEQYIKCGDCEICGVHVSKEDREKSRMINRSWEDYECVCIECANCDLYTRYEFYPKNDDIFYAGMTGWIVLDADGKEVSYHLPTYGPHLPEPPSVPRNPYDIRFWHPIKELFWVFQHMQNHISLGG